MSPLSKYLRILRIENGENAKQMADNLKISPSYLSAIENEKRAIPLSFQTAVIKHYKLSDKDQLVFVQSIEESSSSIKIDFNYDSDIEKIQKVKKIVFTLSKKDVSRSLVDDIYQLLVASK